MSKKNKDIDSSQDEIQALKAELEELKANKEINNLKSEIESLKKNKNAIDSNFPLIKFTMKINIGTWARPPIITLVSE